MIFNQTFTGAIAVVLGYLIGSIPFAYVFTCIATGKDVRKVSGGNVGARNTYINVGKVAGIAAGLGDIGKGFGAVIIAYYLLGAPSRSVIDSPLIFVFAAGLAAVMGHIWPVYLKFKGGNGLATTLGVFCFAMPLPTLISIGLTLVLWIITRNIIFAFNASIFSMPLSGWFLNGLLVYVLFPLAILMVMMLHFYPVIVADIRRAPSPQAFFDELFRRRKNT